MPPPHLAPWLLGTPELCEAFFQPLLPWSSFWSLYWWPETVKKLQIISFLKNVVDFCSSAFHSHSVPSLIPYFIVSHFSSRCRVGRRESGEISFCYFSILCCLKNIHNKYCSKSLIYRSSFSPVLVHFYIFTLSKYWKQIKFSKIEEPGNTANNYSCQARVFSTCLFGARSNWFALYVLQNCSLGLRESLLDLLVIYVFIQFLKM